MKRNPKKQILKRIPTGVTVVWKTDPLTGEKKPTIVPRKAYVRRARVNR